MRILVTGAAGFIGGHVLGALAEAGVPASDVVALDRREMVGWFGGVATVVGDIVGPEGAWESAVGPVDMVIHLAAETAETPEVGRAAVMRTNVLGTDRVVQYAASVGAGVVFASSAAVYGPVAPGTVSQVPDAPGFGLGAYGLSKWLGEEIVRQAALSGRVGGARVLRYANVYGPGGHGLINLAVDAARAGEPLEINGDGGAVRDYVWVQDVAAATVWAALAGEGSGVRNMGTGVGTSVSDAVSAVWAAGLSRGSFGGMVRLRQDGDPGVPWSVLEPVPGEGLVGLGAGIGILVG